MSVRLIGKPHHATRIVNRRSELVTEANFHGSAPCIFELISRRQRQFPRVQAPEDLCTDRTQFHFRVIFEHYRDVVTIEQVQIEFAPDQWRIVFDRDNNMVGVRHSRKFPKSELYYLTEQDLLIFRDLEEHYRRIARAHATSEIDQLTLGDIFDTDPEDLGDEDEILAGINRDDLRTGELDADGE